LGIKASVSRLDGLLRCRKATPNEPNAARQSLFLAGVRLAHHSSLPSKKFLLKFARDRHSYLRWLFEAKKRFGLSVLNYVVTCNHVHLLVRDTGSNAIPNSMQLIAGHSGQEYNQRKGRRGAFWEDRYHATAIAVA
jgi:Transposase IS200 like